MGWGTSPSLNVYPSPSPHSPSYLVLEVLIQNGEFYININMQKVESEEVKYSQCSTGHQNIPG